MRRRIAANHHKDAGDSHTLLFIVDSHTVIDAVSMATRRAS